jgi:hypothetical protein
MSQQTFISDGQLEEAYNLWRAPYESTEDQRF